MDNELHQLAKIAFASEFSFYLKAHNFHWNVRGEGFHAYHELFGDIYEEVYGSIDDFAEKIRGLKANVPASLGKFNMLSEIPDEDSVIPKLAMVKELLMDSEKMKLVFKKVYDSAESAGEVGFSNFLAERIDAHEKHSWMLRSSLGE